jgi:hypothetical protein
MTPEHTEVARAMLGEGPLLAPQMHVVLETDSGRARAAGFDDDDFADGGSDRLLDHLVAWGDEATIAPRVQEHLDAGAERADFPRAEWRALAPALAGLGRR